MVPPVPTNRIQEPPLLALNRGPESQLVYIPVTLAFRVGSLIIVYEVQGGPLWLPTLTLLTTTVVDIVDTKMQNFVFFWEYQSKHTDEYLREFRLLFSVCVPDELCWELVLLKVTLITITAVKIMSITIINVIAVARTLHIRLPSTIDILNMIFASK
jgi:hypothetical protein